MDVTLLKPLLKTSWDNMDFIQAATQANEEIFDLIHSHAPSLYEKHTIGAGGDRSTGVDLQAESIFANYLGSFGKIISEESGEIGSGEKLIYLDPIDGSDNFLSRFPYFGTSVSLESEGKTEYGVICNLANGDLFIKSQERFEKYNLLTKTSSSVNSNPTSSIGLFEKSYAWPKIVEKLMENRLKFRSPGAVALSLAYAHEVQFVLYKGKLRDYDIKAGLFMCESLYTFQDENHLLVSKNEQIFSTLRALIEGRS